MVQPICNTIRAITLHAWLRRRVNPITHFLAGWAVANSAELSPRERSLVAVAGVICDADGLGIVADFLTRDSAQPADWWGRHHHVLGHNLLFAVIVSALALLLASQKWKTAALALASFHLHLLGDLIGARGPDGDQWPIHYLWPLSGDMQLTWSGQWALNAWPNFAITGALLVGAFYLACKRGYSPLEMLSASADAAFVAALRRRFPVAR
jgi:membrane-bound metal-dependent hydrolase YbcI (DUF457 family)